MYVAQNLNCNSGPFVGKPSELRMCILVIGTIPPLQFLSDLDCRLVNWFTYLKNKTPSEGSRFIVKSIVTLLRKTCSPEVPLLFHGRYLRGKNAQSLQ